MGTPPEVAYQLAVGTLIGASTLAQSSADPPQTLRERVASGGGAMHAALTSMEAAGVKAKFEETLFAAQERAGELGRGPGGRRLQRGGRHALESSFQPMSPR